jgi:hypothetical protein
LRSWVKAPDTGFLEIDYAFQEGGAGRSKRGRFNPDFFLWLKEANTVVVCEVKADGDHSWRNKGKMAAAHEYFSEVNRLLEERGDDRRYVACIISPTDYEKFFETVRNAEPEKFTSTLQGILDSRTPD